MDAILPPEKHKKKKHKKKKHKVGSAFAECNGISVACVWDVSTAETLAMGHARFPRVKWKCPIFNIFGLPVFRHGSIMTGTETTILQRLGSRSEVSS
jgi:hypothetical protein